MVATAEATKVCRLYMAGDKTPFLQGPPGIGKTDIVKQIAKDDGLELIVFHPTVKDPVDFSGVPKVVGEYTEWFPPKMLPKTGKGIFFLDELSTASDAMQKACFQFVLSREIAGHKLGDGWRVVTAGNRQQDRAGARQLLSALRNRLGIIDVDVELNAWCRWAFKANKRPEIIAFIRSRPNLLFNFNPQNKELAFPSPRSWAAVSDVMNQEPCADIEEVAYAGLVGEGPSSELMSFLKFQRMMPSLERIILNPDRVEVPSKSDIKYAIAVGLAYRAEPANFDNIVSYALRMPKEFSTLLIHDAVERDESLADTAAFSRWAVETGGF